jgi:hypothetical protein
MGREFKMGFRRKAAKEEDSTIERAAKFLPLPMAVGTGIHAYRKPKLFDPKMISSKLKARSAKGRLASGLLGAAAGAGLGWLPSMTIDATKALFKESAGRKSQDKRERMYAAITAFERAKKAAVTSLVPLPKADTSGPMITMGSGAPAPAPKFPRLSSTAKDSANPGSKFVTKFQPPPGRVKNVTSSKLMTPQSASKTPETGKATKVKLT